MIYAKEKRFRMEMFETDPFFVLRTHIFLGTQIFPEDGTKNARFAPKNYTGSLILKKTQRLFLDLRRQTDLRPIKLSFNESFKTSSRRCPYYSISLIKLYELLETAGELSTWSLRINDIYY